MTSSIPDLGSQAASVSTLDPTYDRRWDAYVEGHPEASVYHLGAWATILRRAYGFKPLYRALERSDGTLAGVLPMMNTRGPLTGRRLRSLPVVPPPSGPIADSEGDLARLIELGCDSVREQRASVWTFQSRQAGLEEATPGLRITKHKTSWIAPLPSDSDELRAQYRRSSKNLHRSISKSEKAGLVTREGIGRDDLRAFYRLYLETMRDHRALPRPLRQMALDQHLLRPRGASRLFVVEHDGEVIAGGLFHVFNGTVELLYNGSRRDTLGLRPNHALYWYVMQWAIERGLKRFDFGDAPPESSLGKFKSQWGSEPGAEFSYTYSPDAGETRADAARRAGGQVGGEGDEGLVARVWKNAPLIATRVAGTIAYRL
jgi:serine/alanine adding enzyme